MLPEHADVKARTRAAAGTRRRQAQADAGPEAGIMLADRFLNAIGLKPGAVVAGYWPLDTEIDTRPLLRRLVAADFTVVLPVVSAPGHPLRFREWTPDSRMHPGLHGIDVPPEDAATITPGVVITPLLAFNGEGWRLGYGGGYYDRTLRELRGLGSAVAIGVGFAAQRIDTVPHDALDEPLDWIVTEDFAKKFDP